MSVAPTSPSPDAIVVGGGIVGLCCTHALTRAGARVELYERAGLTLAPLTGRIVAGLVAGAPADEALGRLGPERFCVQSPYRRSARCAMRSISTTR